MGRPLKWIVCPQCGVPVAAKAVREFIVCDGCDGCNKRFVRNLSASLRGFDERSAVLLARMVIGVPPGPVAA